MTALTARQTAIVAAIRAHVAEHGYPPTVRELGQAVGLHSPSAVAYQLGELTRLGAIRRAPGSPRALAVVDPEPEPDAAFPVSPVAAEPLSGPDPYPSNPPAIPSPQNRSQAVPS